MWPCPAARMCDAPRMPDMSRVLDFLRAIFPYVIAVALPLAGAIIAIAKFMAGDRDDGLRIAAAAVLGICLYALLLG